MPSFNTGRALRRVRPSAPWFAALALVGGAGIGWSMLNADPHTLDAQGALSRFGDDPRVALVFNATALASGLLFLGLARHLLRALEAAATVGALAPAIARVVRATLLVIPPALVATGIFTIHDAIPHLLHDIAGFTPPVLILALMADTTYTAPGSALLNRASLGAVVLLAALFAAARFSTLVPYINMELTGFLVCGVWLWAAEARWWALARAGVTAGSSDVGGIDPELSSAEA